MLKRIQFILTVFVVVSSVTTVLAMLQYDDYIISFVQVGQGDCCLVKTPGGRHILIDSGISKEASDQTPIVKYCSINGIRKIDAAFISHYHQDHAGGMIKLFEEVSCDLLFLPKPVSEEDIACKNQLLSKAKGAKAYYFQIGEKLSLGEDLTIQALFFDETLQASANENCLILKLSCFDTDILYTGDIDIQLESVILDALPDSLLESEIIKVAHHGSKYSSSDQFYYAVKPRDAVICVGENSYGHPSEEAMNRIKQAGATIHRTDLEGTIHIRVNQNGYAFPKKHKGFLL